LLNNQLKWFSFGEVNAGSAEEQPAMNNKTTEVLTLPQCFIGG
jgi:hypothetical protein